MGALRCGPRRHPVLKEQGWGRIVNISGTTPATPANLSGGARNVSWCTFTKTLAVQLGRYGITVNCCTLASPDRAYPKLGGRSCRQLACPQRRRNGATSLLITTGNASAAWWMRRNRLVTAFLASEKAWAISGELIVATGGAGRSVYY